MGQTFVFHFESLSELGFVGLKDGRIGEQRLLLHGADVRVSFRITV